MPPGAWTLGSSAGSGTDVGRIEGFLFLCYGLVGFSNGFARVFLGFRRVFKWFSYGLVGFLRLPMVNSLAHLSVFLLLFQRLSMILLWHYFHHLSSFDSKKQIFEKCHETRQKTQKHHSKQNPTNLFSFMSAKAS